MLVVRTPLPVQPLTTVPLAAFLGHCKRQVRSVQTPLLRPLPVEQANISCGCQRSVSTLLCQRNKLDILPVPLLAMLQRTGNQKWKQRIADRLHVHGGGVIFSAINQPLLAVGVIGCIALDGGSVKSCIVW